MPTITIPKELTKKGDLVVVPLKEYEILLRTSKKKSPLFDLELLEALDDIKKGKIYGPFRSVKSLRRSLER